MIYAGEDERFIARRIMICASEDVGNADPMALTVAVSAAQAVERVGFPEAQIILAQAASYVACAPKSNSAVMAIDKAMRSVREPACRPIFRMPIMAEPESLGTASGINTPTITRIIMWSSSICPRSFWENGFMNLQITDMSIRSGSISGR